MEKNNEYLNQNITLNKDYLYREINIEQENLGEKIPQILNKKNIDKNIPNLEPNIHREDFYKLEKKLEQIGTTKEILRNEYFLNAIIAYNGEHPLICALFKKVNEGIKDGTLTDEDLEFFRSGKLIDTIINLKETAKVYGKRNTHPTERADKINYISLIEDIETLSVSYTHPEIIDALCGNRHYDPNFRDLTYFVEYGSYNNLPKEVQMAIISEVSKRGNIEVVQLLLQSAIGNIKKYPTNNQNYKK